VEGGAAALWREQSDGAGTRSGGGEEGFFLRSHGDRRLVELTDVRLGVRVTGGGRFELFYSWTGGRNGR